MHQCSPISSILDWTFFSCLAWAGESPAQRWPLLQPSTSALVFFIGNLGPWTYCSCVTCEANLRRSLFSLSLRWPLVRMPYATYCVLFFSDTLIAPAIGLSTFYVLPKSIRTSVCTQYPEGRPDEVDLIKTAEMAYRTMTRLMVYVCHGNALSPWPSKLFCPAAMFTGLCC